MAAQNRDLNEMVQSLIPRLERVADLAHPAALIADEDPVASARRFLQRDRRKLLAELSEVEGKARRLWARYKELAHGVDVIDQQLARLASLRPPGDVS